MSFVVGAGIPRVKQINVEISKTQIKLDPRENAEHYSCSRV
jgi:hypothetical protein